MTRKEIEQKAVERFPDTGFYGIFQEKRQAYIEGALMVVESQWISVKDRLPTNNDDVIVIGNGWDEMNWWRIYFFEDGVWFTIDGNEVSKQAQLKITHWQPLPEPPKPTK